MQSMQELVDGNNCNQMPILTPLITVPSDSRVHELNFIHAGNILKTKPLFFHTTALHFTQRCRS